MQQEPHGAALGVQRGSEPENHTAPPNRTQTPIDLVAHRAPWAGPDELALRRRLHRAGTIAQAQATREKNSTARELLWVLAMTAARWTFRRVDNLAVLERILRACNQMFMAADNIRQEEGADDA